MQVIGKPAPQHSRSDAPCLSPRSRKRARGPDDSHRKKHRVPQPNQDMVGKLRSAAPVETSPTPPPVAEEDRPAGQLACSPATWQALAGLGLHGTWVVPMQRVFFEAVCPPSHCHGMLARCRALNWLLLKCFASSSLLQRHIALHPALMGQVASHPWIVMTRRALD